MLFLGEVEFVEGREVKETAALILRQCLKSPKTAGRKDIDKFLQGMEISPEAFFRDINGDWSGRPFLGKHLFKIAQAAGYEGTEHDLWQAVTGSPAPYAVKKTPVNSKQRFQQARAKVKRRA